MFSGISKTFKSSNLAENYITRYPGDCLLIFDEEKLSVPKIILAYSSPVFDSMFYGPMASSEIPIIDIEAEDFKQALQFIYTSKVDIISMINAWSLFYVGHKYFITDLMNVCIDYISFNLTLEMLLLSYEYAELYNLKQLVDRCWHDILLNAKEVLAVDYHMLPQTFCALLDEEKMNATEKDLVEAAIKWCDEECLIQNLEVTAQNRSKILVESGLYSKIRFWCLGCDTFQYLNYFFGHSTEKINNYFFTINPNRTHRQPLPSNLKFRFRQTYKVDRNIVIHNENSFQCDIVAFTKIVVNGIAITPPHQSGFVSTCSNATISIFKNNEELLNETTDFIKVNGYDNPHLVYLLKGVTFEADVPYRICVKYSLACNSYRLNELLLFHLDSCIKTHANSMNISFKDDFYGGVIRGISFYAA